MDRNVYLAELRRQDFLAEAERERRIDAALAAHHPRHSPARTIVPGFSISLATRWARIASLLRKMVAGRPATEPC